MLLDFKRWTAACNNKSFTADQTVTILGGRNLLRIISDWVRNRSLRILMFIAAGPGRPGSNGDVRTLLVQRLFHTHRSAFRKTESFGDVATRRAGLSAEAGRITNLPDFKPLFAMTPQPRCAGTTQASFGDRAPGFVTCPRTSGSPPRWQTSMCSASRRPTWRTWRARLRRLGVPIDPLIMLSSGGGSHRGGGHPLPIRMLESGPAGGALGAIAFGRTGQRPDQLAFDMGGTTAKLCVIERDSR